MTLFDKIFNLGYDQWDDETITVVEHLHNVPPSEIVKEIEIAREYDSKEYLHLLLQLSIEDMKFPGCKSLAELIPSLARPSNLESELQDDENKNLELRNSA